MGAAPKPRLPEEPGSRSQRGRREGGDPPSAGGEEGREGGEKGKEGRSPKENPAGRQRLTCKFKPADSQFQREMVTIRTIITTLLIIAITIFIIEIIRSSISPNPRSQLSLDRGRSQHADPLR